MAETSRAKKAAASSDRADRIGGLPDAVLPHILGFLPADEAVRTSVLARRWRHLWRSLRRLRVTKEGSWESAEHMVKFMNSLLLLSPDVALEEVEFREATFLEDVADSTLNIWIRHVLLCRAQVLSIYIPANEISTFKGPALVAQSLRKLELGDVILKGSFLDFTSCPALEYLGITSCDIRADRLLSQSIKHLIIDDGSFDFGQIRISAPSIISLQLQGYKGTAPLLEDMPSLETAIFSFGCNDYCKKGPPHRWSCCSCVKCGPHYAAGGRDSSILILGGFSSATNLELIFDSGTLIFSRWCPTFSKLKTLLLHVPKEVNDLQWMACILEHSPILEKLTIIVPEGARELERSHQVTVQLSVISERLNAVEIKCGQVDEMVYKILKLLGSFVKEINSNLTGQP